MFCSIPEVALALAFLLALLGLADLAELDDIRLMSSVLSAKGDDELAGPLLPSPASPRLKRELLMGESVRSAPPRAENEPRNSRSRSARRLLLLEPRVPIPL